MEKRVKNKEQNREESGSGSGTGAGAALVGGFVKRRREDDKKINSGKQQVGEVDQLTKLNNLENKLFNIVSNRQKEGIGNDMDNLKVADEKAIKEFYEKNREMKLEDYPTDILNGIRAKAARKIQQIQQEREKQKTDKTVEKQQSDIER